jgi:phosphohistidine swiveling domain-containing protein
MTHDYIFPLSAPAVTLVEVGGKGASLSRLVAAGLPVPDGFHITTAAYHRFVTENDLQPGIMAALGQVDTDQPVTMEAASKAIQALFTAAKTPPDVANAIIQAYADLAERHPAVAVRSSATAEDLPVASFAGQQETYLNVQGTAQVLEAVKKCWASLWTARAISYRIRNNIEHEQVSLAVVVQVLVPAQASGVMFTANPLNGKLDQLVINAAWGLGEAVVGGLVTPDLMILDKKNSQLIGRVTADKQVMTVRTNGATEEQPVAGHLRKAPVLNNSIAVELGNLGLRIEELYGMPMDIEWALAGGKFYILQARPITALPGLIKDVGLEWTLPDPKGQYMRASICELLPDPLSPLFSTLGMKAIETGINEMANDLFGMPVGSLSGFMLAINGYAYQKVSFTGRQWLLLLTRMLPGMPRVLKEGVRYWEKIAHPLYAQAVVRWQDRTLSDLKPVEIWSGVHEIIAAFAQHLGSLMASTMGPTAGSEGLFTQVYDKLVRKDGDPAAPAFLMGFDSIPIKAEKALYDLSMWCIGQPSVSTYLINTPSGQITRQLSEGLCPEGVSGEAWDKFHSRFRQYLEDYGYSIYDMDFAKPLPMEDPEPILETFRLFITGQGKNPYERQQASVARRKVSEEAVRARLKGIRRWSFEKTLKWAQSQAPLREDGIAEIGLGYPVLRRMLLELGRRFTEVGALREAEDIFWLEETEVEMAVASFEHGETLNDFYDCVQERKALWARQKQLIPPAQLPPGKKYLGLNMEGILAVGESSQEGSTIKGVGTSPGQVKGTARVLRDPKDFDQMQPGDVLVASVTTPAWTPLFAMACGIVTDIGGPLSHGSIVAREYGIPAVLGTGVATRRIHSGQTVTVDGNTGVVILH